MKSRSVSEAVERIPEGASLVIDGFMGVGMPERLIATGAELKIADGMSEMPL